MKRALIYCSAVSIDARTIKLLLNESDKLNRSYLLHVAWGRSSARGDDNKELTFACPISFRLSHVGMNVVNGMEESHAAFFALVGGSVAMSFTMLRGVMMHLRYESCMYKLCRLCFC